MGKIPVAPPARHRDQSRKNLACGGPINERTSETPRISQKVEGGQGSSVHLPTEFRKLLRSASELLVREFISLCFRLYDRRLCSDFPKLLPAIYGL